MTSVYTLGDVRRYVGSTCISTKGSHWKCHNYSNIKILSVQHSLQIYSDNLTKWLHIRQYYKCMKYRTIHNIIQSVWIWSGYFLYNICLLDSFPKFWLAHCMPCYYNVTQYYLRFSYLWNDIFQPLTLFQMTLLQKQRHCFLRITCRLSINLLINYYM